MKNLFLVLYSLVLCLPVFSQKKNHNFSYSIYPATQKIIVDGIVGENEWSNAAMASDFFTVLPMDTSHATVDTQVFMAYDQDNLYLLAICYKKIKGTEVVESLRRDFDFTKNDNFVLFLDPFDDRTNGFAFGVNAVGAQWDGQLYDGGKADLNWDNIWHSATKNEADKFVVEMAIPYKTLRFKKDSKSWGVNFSRNDVKTTEKSSWAPVPRQFPTSSLAYTGNLIWDAPPPSQGANISLIPYLVSGLSKSYQPAKNAIKKMEAGLDAKIGITSSLNLDLTINPDFSQVEVDKQITNLDRYELFFPERRQFFLENGDQINNFGYATIRPFFSRRIGLTAPIEAGARLSGKINQKWRMTAMDVQTARESASGVPNQNFTVMALQRKLFSRSNINLLFVNKQSVHYGAEKDTLPHTWSEYNRNLGIEYNLATAKNTLTGKLVFLKSFSPGVTAKDFTGAGNLQYAGKRWLVNTAFESVGENYNAEVGYVPRKNYHRFYPSVSYFFFPKSGKILTHGPQLTTNYFFTHQLHETDHQNALSYLLTFRDRATLSATMLDDKVELLFDFDPTNSKKDSLQKGSLHQWKTVGVDFVSKQQRSFTYNYSMRYGGYYASGKKLSLNAGIGYRFQPFLNLQMNASFNELQLPQPWGNTSFWLVGPRIDVTFTNKVFFTTYIQYNQQIKNTNINARFQWRYKPGSDFFLVYTDNYLTAPFSVRTRAIQLKFNYWWNL